MSITRQSVTFGLMTVFSLFHGSLAGSAANASPSQPAVEIKLEIEPDNALPGVPVEFRMTVTNRSKVPVTVPPALKLHVRPANGKAFFANHGFPHENPTLAAWPDEMGKAFRLKPGETRIFYEGIDGSLGNPAWFWEERLNRPGTYRLQIVSEPAPPQWQDVFRKPFVPPGDLIKEPIASSVAEFVVQEPAGEDAMVWKMMQTLAKGQWTARHFATYGSRVAAEMWKTYRTSGYLHDLATLITLDDRQEKTAALLAALAMKPDGSRADWIRVALASHYSNMALETASDHGADLKKAESFAQEARNLLAPLFGRVKSPSLLWSAERAMEAVPNRNRILALRNRNPGNSPTNL